MLSKIEDIDTKSVITIFYGIDVNESEAEDLVESITSQYPSIECGAIFGEQKTYDYYMAIE